MATVINSVADINVGDLFLPNCCLDPKGVVLMVLAITAGSSKKTARVKYSYEALFVENPFPSLEHLLGPHVRMDSCQEETFVNWCHYSNVIVISSNMYNRLISHAEFIY